MKKVKLLIVDDSAFVVKIIKSMVSHSPDIEVVGVARNGKEAVEKTALLKPDIITMDIEMPVMNGLEAVRRIMAENPTPILMVSSLTKDGAKETIEALSLGAIDFLTKQSAFSLDQTPEMRDEVLGKIKEIARSSMLRSRLSRTQSILESLSHNRRNRNANRNVSSLQSEKQRNGTDNGTEKPAAKSASKTQNIFKPVSKGITPSSRTNSASRSLQNQRKGAVSPTERRSFSQQMVKELHPDADGNKVTGRKRLPPSHFKIAVLGVSTGGPLALHQVIPRLPKDLPVALLIVQHMPPHFTKSLADRLDSLSQVKVCEASDGDVITPGCVYIAPGGLHMTVSPKARNIVIHPEPASTLHRPSVDVMVESVVEQVQGNALGIIMTGMGRDGMLGLRKLHGAGGFVLAQNEETCVVYGMPKAVVDDKIADEIHGLEHLADAISECLGVRALSA